MKPVRCSPSATRPEPGEEWLRDALAKMEIVSAHSRFLRSRRSTGGVSSDIYRVDLPSGVTVCVKRALPKLKVTADWLAPISRNRWEAEWMRVAGAIVPSAVPRILGEDRDAGCFAMEYFPPDRYPTWKALLAAGIMSATEAAQVGDTLGRIHAATANRGDVAARFETDDIFYDIRLEPYLVATAAAHPQFAARLDDLVETTATPSALWSTATSARKISCAGPPAR